MQAGALRRRVQIQEATETADAAGQMIPTWATTFERSAEIITKGGGELFRAQQVQANITAVIRLRNDSRLRVPAKGRILYGDRVFDVQWVDDVGGRGRELLVYCVEQRT